MGKYRRAGKRETNNTQASLEKIRETDSETKRIETIALKGLIESTVYGGSQPSNEIFQQTMNIIRKVEREDTFSQRILELKPSVGYDIESKQWKKWKKGSWTYIYAPRGAE
jgi:hypothetical protein